jgi:hypothetical protein
MSIDRSSFNVEMLIFFFLQFIKLSFFKSQNADSGSLRKKDKISQTHSTYRTLLGTYFKVLSGEWTPTKCEYFFWLQVFKEIIKHGTSNYRR